jgi:hypothetical protein
MPSCPLSLEPQHLTTPPEAIAHVWDLPVEMAMAERPGQGGGDELARWPTDKGKCLIACDIVRDIVCYIIAYDIEYDVQAETYDIA